MRFGKKKKNQTKQTYGRDMISLYHHTVGVEATQNVFKLKAEDDTCAFRGGRLRTNT